MLSKVAQNLVRNAVRSYRFTVPTVQAFQFSSNALSEKANNLKRILSDQIKYQQDNKPELTQQLNYFQDSNWSVSHSGTQVMLSKSNGPYHLRVLFNVRTPISQSEEEQPQQQAQQENEDYAEVSTYVSKDGKKWLCAEFMVVNNECHMSMANFIEDFEFEKRERQANRAVPRYNGPELGTLQSSVLDSVTEFLEAVGIDNNLLVQSADYAVAYEHKFYIEWLKNFEAIC